MGKIKKLNDDNFNIKMAKAAQGQFVHNKKNSKYTGVRYNPQKVHKWSSIIKYNKKNHYLGSFMNEKDAGLAYDQKALEFYGPNARRNFPRLTLEEITKKLIKIKTEDAALFQDYFSKIKQGKLCNVPQSSIYTGVTYDKRGKTPWRAIIQHQKKIYYLGYYNTEEEAARAYDKKAIELYGKNANLNCPESKVVLSKKTDSSNKNRKKYRVLDTRNGLKQTITIRTKDDVKDFDFKRSKAIQGKSGNTNFIQKSIYIGVRFDQKRIQHPWYSSIKYNNKSYYLGSYIKDEYAALAYDKKALELYGHDATRNFPALSMKELTKKIAIIQAENAVVFYDIHSRCQQGTLREYKDFIKSSKFVGVSFNKYNSRWKASIGYRKKRRHLGYFNTQEDAAEIYDSWAKYYYGDKARLNFPEC